jgi:hypothetical protein
VCPNFWLCIYTVYLLWICGASKGWRHQIKSITCRLPVVEPWCRVNTGTKVKYVAIYNHLSHSYFRTFSFWAGLTSNPLTWSKHSEIWFCYQVVVYPRIQTINDLLPSTVVVMYWILQKLLSFYLFKAYCKLHRKSTFVNSVRKMYYS